MAVKTRRQYAGGAAATTIGGSLASSAVTTFSITAATGWPASTTIPFYVVVSPQTASEEKMLVTINGLTLTVVARGVDGTTANAHASGAAIYPVVTAVDLDEANELASTYAHTGAIAYQGASTFSELTIGSTGHVLKVSSSLPSWGQVDTAGIADSAVTSAKIAANTVAAGDIADAFKKLVCPVGTITAFGGATAPTGWLLCDGNTISAGYTELIALIGSATPDLRGRFPLGDNASLDLLATGGSLSITNANLPSHNHTFSATSTGQSQSHNHTVSLSDPGHNHTQNPHSHTTQATVSASSGAHNNTTDYVAAGTNGASTTPTISSISTTTATNQASGTGISVSSVGNASQDHTHSVSGTTGQTGTNQDYYPPYVVLNFIIKHDY